MKILFVNDYEEYGSTEKLIYYLRKNLWEMETIWTKLYTMPFDSRQFKKILDSWKPDIVHFHLCLLPGILPYVIVKDRKIPMVITLHNYWMVCRATHHFLFRENRPCPHFDWSNCSNCPNFGRGNIPFPEKIFNFFKDVLLVGCSEHISEVYRRFGYENVVTVHNGIPPVEGKIEDRDFVFSLVSTKPWKGPMYVRRLHKEAEYEVKYNMSSSPYDPGYLSEREVDRLYRTCSVVVVPSIWEEPGSIVPLEAARCRKPTVCFDIGGLPEYPVSMTVPVGSYESLKEAVDTLMSDRKKRRRLGREAYKKYISSFTDVHMTEKYIKIYEGLL